jgi:glycosyltransferase involved in cell wall biosynthesis
VTARATPKVSVAIPAYNSGAYITHTIESVLAQDAREYELLVCDDSSTDATPDICARYASRGLV